MRRQPFNTDEGSIVELQDQGLAKLLHLVDGFVAQYDFQAAKAELGKIPGDYEWHAEVLRRRLRHQVYEDEDFKDLPTAARWARALVEAEPHDSWNWLFLDDVTSRLEGNAAAVEVLREGLRRYGPDFCLYYELASRLCALERLEEAKEAMLMALKKDPFALESALESPPFAPIREYIQELKVSAWYKSTPASLDRK